MNVATPELSIKFLENLKAIQTHLKYCMNTIKEFILKRAYYSVSEFIERGVVHLNVHDAAALLVVMGSHKVPI